MAPPPNEWSNEYTSLRVEIRDRKSGTSWPGHWLSNLFEAGWWRAPHLAHTVYTRVIYEPSVRRSAIYRGREKWPVSIYRFAPTSVFDPPLPRAPMYHQPTLLNRFLRRFLNFETDSLPLPPRIFTTESRGGGIFIFLIFRSGRGGIFNLCVFELES